MALMLTSAGITNGSIRNELRRLVARPFDTASVAVVMTAAVGDQADLQRLHRLGGESCHPPQRRRQQDVRVRQAGGRVARHAEHQLPPDPSEGGHDGQHGRSLDRLGRQAH